MPLEDFPETGRTTPVDPIVAMVKRPNAIRGCLEDLAAKDPKPQPNKDIKAMFANCVEVGLLEPVGEFRPSGCDFQHRHVGQEFGGVHGLIGIRPQVAATPSVEFAIEQIEQTAAGAKQLGEKALFFYRGTFV